MRPAAAQPDQPDSAHQLQHGTHQRTNAGHAHCQTHRTGQADTHAAQHRCDSHRPARTAQNKGLAGQLPGGNDTNDQRRPQAAVPQPDRARRAQAGVPVRPQGKIKPAPNGKGTTTGENQHK